MKKYKKDDLCQTNNQLCPSFLSYLTPEECKLARLLASSAINSNKIFMCEGSCEFVRSSLRKRGWVEKLLHFSDLKNEILTNSSEQDSKEKKSFYEFLHQLVSHQEPILLWFSKKNASIFNVIKPFQLINHFAKASFTSKIGLTNSLQDLVWFKNCKSDSFYPRTYKIINLEERRAFINDFYLTTCISLLKMLSPTFFHHNYLPSKVYVLPERVYILAYNVCKNYLDFLTNNDIDDIVKPVKECSFELILKSYYEARIFPGNITVSDFKNRLILIDNLLKSIKSLSPQFLIDGINNVWILKPGASSRGRGVFCLNCLDNILKTVHNQTSLIGKNLILQKYIERPLLIHETKFDIRQWFLVTDWNPLTIWMYKSSYLRFCSSKFTLKNFHKAIHLTNNSIQKNFQVDLKRSLELPKENMWTHLEFINFLKNSGVQKKVWDEVIYEQMKQAIINSMLCSQSEAPIRKNSFELYGADFMISDDYQPWLIEINLCPCLLPTTPVTAMMCPQVIEDTFKVILDRKENKNADTGAFEMVFYQNQITIPLAFGKCFNIKGKALNISRQPVVSKIKNIIKNTESLHSQNINLGRIKKILKEAKDPNNLKTSNNTLPSKSQKENFNNSLKPLNKLNESKSLHLLKEIKTKSRSCLKSVPNINNHNFEKNSLQPLKLENSLENALEQVVFRDYNYSSSDSFNKYFAKLYNSIAKNMNVNKKKDSNLKNFYENENQSFEKRYNKF